MKEKGRLLYPFEETNLDVAYGKEAQEYTLAMDFYTSEYWALFQLEFWADVMRVFCATQAQIQEVETYA